MKMDYIIIGQGLAGSLLALQFLKRGKSIVIVDDHHTTSSSMMAAGMINPITGKRLILTGGFAKYLPAARAAYDELQQTFDKPFYIPKRILYFFKSQEELDRYHQNRRDPDAAPHCGPFFPPGTWSSCDDRLGSYEILNGGYCDTALLMTTLKDHFAGMGILRNEQFRYGDIHLHDGEAAWKDIRCKKIIFCEGYRTRENPWFRSLPFIPAKGEILTLAASTPLPDAVLNKGKWITPFPDGTFKAGANYVWDTIDCEPTPSARQDILEEIQNFVKADFTLKDHRAGVRPAIHDHYPVLGEHPDHPALVIFNGLGSKGVLKAPYYSEHLSAWLEKETELEARCNVKRFYRGA